MYNRYISDRHGDDNFVPVSQHSDYQAPAPQPQAKPASADLRMADGPEAVPAVSQHKSLLGNLFGKRDGKTGLLGSLFGGFDLGDIDIGDIILILILILMFIDSEEYDFLIIIALIVFLGF